MNIWLIQTGEDIPFGNNIRKLRTAILAEELVRRGHRVTWWAASFSHLRKEWFVRDKDSLELDSGVSVELLHGRGYKSNVSVARVIDHRIVARQFRKRSREVEQPDLILCSLPPYDLAFEAAKYAKRRGIRFIVDARDYWPDIFVDLVPSLLQPLVRFVLYTEFRMARLAFQQADSITAMSEDNLVWALSYCDRERSERDRVFHLGFRSAPQDEVQVPEWLHTLDGRFIVAFVGTFSKFHSPLTLIRAAALLEQEGREDIAIVIAGAGGDIEPQIRSEAAGLGNVTMPGWLDQTGIEALLSRASIGVCPTSTEARFFPNKTFLYFSRGLPVLSAFEGELRSVLDGEGLGRYFRHDDAAALAANIKEYCDDAALHEKTRGRVEKAFKERYDESVVYAAFAKHIEQMAGG